MTDPISNHNDDEGAEVFGVITSDFSLNLMFIVLLASASLVADSRLELADVQLHTAKTSAATVAQDAPPTHIMLTIDRHGRITLDGHLLEPQAAGEVELARRLQALLEQRGDALVLIAPDAAAPWQSVATANLALHRVTQNFHTLVDTTPQGEQR